MAEQRTNKLHIWRERFRGALVQEPVLISLTLRWFGWLIALVIVVLGAAPVTNLQNAPWVLAITLVQLVGMSVYPKRLRKYLPGSASDLMPVLWPIPDILISLWAIYQTGGWDSPFYHFGITTVLAPSLRFGLLGALLSSTLFTSLYILTVKITKAGFTPAYLDSTQAEPGLISSPLNPLMIGLYAAFLGEVLTKLRQEMERSRLLAAENERARMSRDIHDGVSQTLFMLAMSLETGQVLAEKEKATKTSKHLEKLTPVAQKALIELRNAMYSVEPLADGQQTLQQAVGQLVRDYRSATGQQIDFEAAEDFHCPQNLASELFRMTQEALSNACQHANAERVQLRLSDRSLCVSDNGSGFEQDQTKRGRGLDNLESRAKEAQVSYSLKTGDSGTCVTFSWSEETQ